MSVIPLLLKCRLSGKFSALFDSQAAQTTVELIRKQYQLGTVNYQTQLIAEQNYQLAVINLVQAQASRFGDTVALYQALGGDWWNRSYAIATQDIK